MTARNHTCRPEVSFVLATHNRCEVVRETLARVRQCGIDRHEYEILVVDNASTDGTADAVVGDADRVIRLRRNLGSCAKAVAARDAQGRYVVFLDDDSSPRPGSITQMIRHFEHESSLAAAGFKVHLPNGVREGAALPHVFVGCGVGFRSDALRAVGGLDLSFFMQAEEYDLSFRLAAAGWQVRLFDDLHVDHAKTSTARRHARTMFYDVRNNLRVAARFLPRRAFRVYRHDWLQRYRWLADSPYMKRAFLRGKCAGTLLSWGERMAYRDRRLDGEPFERFFRWDFIASRFHKLAEEGVRHVVLADLGKNVYPFVRAASLAGVSVLAVGDDRFAAPKRLYRGIPVEPVKAALDRQPDCVVVANTGPVHASRTASRLRESGLTLVHDWFGSPGSQEDLHSGVFSDPISSDEKMHACERMVRC